MQFETLESRQLMAADVWLTAGVLNVVGDSADDHVHFRQIGSYISIDGNEWWSASKVKSIFVNLGDGNDFVSVNSFANGGSKALKEAVTVVSGAGNDHVQLANSHDVYFNGPGNTLAVKSNGSATLNGAALNFKNNVVTSYKYGVLTVTGTNAGDHIALRQTNGKIYIAGVSGSWTASKVTSIVINLQNGNDSVSLNSLANGGNQALAKAISVRSGAGNETVHLANGHDVNFTGPGHVLTVSTNGAVQLDGQTLTWNDPAPPPPNPNPNWFDTYIQDGALRALGSSLYSDNLISRGDALSLFNSAKDGSVVDSTELADLRRIVDNWSLFGSDEYTRTLTSYIAYGTVANTRYQGSQLGNLGAGSHSTHLDKLVNKWFLGLDRPTASGTYQQIAGTLFVNGAQYSDVNQGSVGDCYYLAALAEVALRSNNTITSMFIVNGDGTYGVKFKNPSGQNVYVTVDSYLPTNGSYVVYAHVATNGSWTYSSTNELWVALAEKAYAQVNEFGWSRAGFTDDNNQSQSGLNSYEALSGGYVGYALEHITGLQSSWAMTDADYTPGSNSNGYNFATFVNAYNAGKLIGFASYGSPASGSGVVGGHAYAVTGYNASNQTVTLYNPWGLNNGSAPGTLTMSWSQIQQNFAYFDFTV
jgi:hypothetical protein